jgi:hypothetical protein
MDDPIEHKETVEIDFHRSEVCKGHTNHSQLVERPKQAVDPMHCTGTRLSAPRGHCIHVHRVPVT